MVRAADGTEGQQGELELTGAVRTQSSHAQKWHGSW